MCQSVLRPTTKWFSKWNFIVVLPDIHTERKAFHDHLFKVTHLCTEELHFYAYHSLSTTTWRHSTYHWATYRMHSNHHWRICITSRSIHETLHSKMACQQHGSLFLFAYPESHHSRKTCELHWRLSTYNKHSKSWKWPVLFQYCKHRVHSL